MTQQPISGLDIPNVPSTEPGLAALADQIEQPDPGAWTEGNYLAAPAIDPEHEIDPSMAVPVVAPASADEVPVIDADTINQADTDADLQVLDQLLALYDQAEAEANEAAEKFDAIKTAVKGILYDLRPTEDTRKIALRSSQLATPLEMIFVEGRRTLDRKALTRAYPGLDLTHFEKQGKSSWTMRRGKLSE